jgi:arsenate reductase
MAEAIVNARYPEWQAFSAGIHPTGFVHPMTLQVLREIGIEHCGASKSLEAFTDTAFDLVITVCDDAKEACPVWSGIGRRLHRSFPDPAKASGSDQERLEVFRRVRDQIAASIAELLAS